MVNTGGNFMSDGMGNAFASNLILEENDGWGPYGSVNYPNHNEAEIDDLRINLWELTNTLKWKLCLMTVFIILTCI